MFFLVYSMSESPFEVNRTEFADLAHFGKTSYIVLVFAVLVFAVFVFAVFVVFVLSSRLRGGSLARGGFVIVIRARREKLAA